MRISDWSSDVCSSDLLEPAHGALVTSATLKGADGWPSAEVRIGAAHLDVEPARFAADSPFDYAINSEVLIVTDIKRGDLAALSGAYSRLIEAAGGGTPGIFPGIQRLKTGNPGLAHPARKRVDD